MKNLLKKSFKDETAKAWAGSILFHLLLALILYFTHMEEKERLTGFVEVTLGTFGTVLPPQTSATITDERPEAAAVASAPVVIKRPKSMKVDLPERKFPVADEVLRLPETRKLDAAEHAERKSEVERSQQWVGEKDFGAGRTLEAEKLSGEGKRGTSGEGGGFAGSTVGAAIGRSIGYSVQWVGGGTRQKISGELPTYPEGVNLEAQIKLQAVVAPDGSVKSLQPIQKAHVKFEDAAMQEVRFWKFEPLALNRPQVDQNCTITFNFRLK